MENELFELTRKRRSVRRYKNTEIDGKIIDEIMKVALTAPTAFGNRDVSFVTVRDKKLICEIGKCKTYGGSQINGADTVIVVMVKTSNARDAEFWIEDGAIASAYLLLAAEQYGLGCCWVHIRNRTGRIRTSDEEIRELLNISSDYTVLNLIALGEKNEIKKAYTEEDLDYSKIRHID
ncbi:MAG: nitroreductase family protein [Clostridiales bacterium]|nr:nitroreductase family protein [Clostridiales bacterium]